MKRHLLIIILTIGCVQSHAQTILPAVLGCTTTLTAAGSPYIIQTNSVVQPGCQLTVNPGVEIKMNDTCNLIIRGKADFLGTASQPIFIHANDTTWGSIFLDSTMDHCTFNNVIIQDGRFTPDHYSPLHVAADTNLQRAAFSSYYSSFELNNCIFKNNLQCIYAKYGAVTITGCSFDSTNVREKMNIQFVRNAVVDGCFFSRTYGHTLYDCIDFDGIHNGIIKNNFMYYGEDDGVDLGEWESKQCDSVLVINNHIEGMLYGKGVSIGERSRHITVQKNLIINCGIGIAVKDSSEAMLINNTLNADSTGISAYQKTAGWGGGVATVKNTIIANSILFDTKTDPLSSITVDYSLSNTSTMPGTGNLMGNPLFVSIPAKNFLLQAGSPCINTGDPAMTDPDLSRIDMGAFPYDPSAAGVTETPGNDAVLVYPNPSDGIIQVNFTHQGNYLLTIDNYLGQTVYSNASIGSQKDIVNISGQPAGIYFLHIVSPTKTITKKIMLR